MKCRAFSSLLVFTSLCTFLAVPQIRAQSFEPGIWKAKESVTLNGLELPAHSSEDCLSSIQANEGKTTIEKELKKRGCTLKKWVVLNEKLDAEIDCKNKNFEAVGKLSGLFSKKSYKLKGEAKGTIQDVLFAVAELELNGQWVKACAKK